MCMCGKMNENNLITISTEKFIKLFNQSDYNQTSFCRDLKSKTGVAISNYSISHWMSGRKNIPVKYLEALCTVFNVDASDLIEGNISNPSEAELNILSGKHKILSDRIGYLLMMSNMTQDELGDRLAIETGKSFSSTTISLWLNNHRNIPIKYLKPLSNIFGVTEPYLLGLTDNYDEDYGEIKTKETEQSNLFEIDPWQLYAYDKQPVFVVFSNFEHENEWALYNRKKKSFVFCNEILKEQRLKDANAHFFTKDITRLTDNTILRKTLDYASFMENERVYVEMTTANTQIQGEYNGWYRHNENHTALINSQGLVLPYDGFKKAYLAYAYKADKSK